MTCRRGRTSRGTKAPSCGAGSSPCCSRQRPSLNANQTRLKERAAGPRAVSRESCHFDYQPVACELTFLLGFRCRSLQNEVARFRTDQGVHRSEFPSVLSQSGQVAGGEAGAVLSLLSDKLHSLRGNPSPEVYIRDLVFPSCQCNRLLCGEPAQDQDRPLMFYYETPRVVCVDPQHRVARSQGMEKAAMVVSAGSGPAHRSPFGD